MIPQNYPCGRRPHSLHTKKSRKTADVDERTDFPSTPYQKPQQNAQCGRVDSVDSLKGVPGASTRRPVLPRDARS